MRLPRPGALPRRLRAQTRAAGGAAAQLCLCPAPRRDLLLRRPLFCGRRKLEAGDLLVPPRPARRQSGRGRLRLPRRKRLHPLHVAVRVLRQAGRHPPRPRLQRACGALQAAGRKLPAQRALFCLVGTNGARRYETMICGGLGRGKKQGKATALPCYLYKNAQAAIATAPARSKASGARQK